MSHPLPKYLIHSLYSYTNETDQNPADDFVFITYKEGTDDTPRMKIIRDTSVEYFITKPGLRTQNIKRQTCPYDELDGYHCQEKDLRQELIRALGIRNPNARLADLLQNIYVYGADIPSEYHIRTKYNEDAAEDARAHKLPESIPFSMVKVGALDIETSVLGGNEIICITFVDSDFHAYTAIYKPFLKGASEAVVREHVAKALEPKKEKYGLDFTLFIHEDEREMIKWVFDKLHNSKCDFVSIWNMGFDIPYIKNRLEFLQEDPMQYFCNPKIPQRYKSLKYIQGKTRKAEHFAERWDWCQFTATFQFYDSKALFAKIRKVDGHENSYTLGYILEKYLGASDTKLYASEESTHYVMQTTRFLDYIAYNIWDGGGLIALEKEMRHINNLISLSMNNPYAIFAKGTVKGRNSYYTFCKSRQYALCSVRGDNSGDYDEEIPALGGAVLNPNLAMDIGVQFLKESRRISKVHTQDKDIDAKSMYPRVSITINDSKDTVIYTVMKVNGNKDVVEDFCTDYVSIEENAVRLLTTYFNIPSYQEMVNLYREEKNKLVA